MRIFSTRKRKGAHRPSSERRPWGRGKPQHRFGFVEVLESRRVLAQIVWDNFAESDNFSIYGANENVARAITIRAITDWARVITDFNYDSGGNTFHLEIIAGGAGGCGSALTTGVEVSSGKPTHAEVRMHTVGCGGTPWYFDPTIGTTALPDDSEFTELITPFAARRPGNDNMFDFYTAVTHEIGHALGINGGHSDLKILDYLSGPLMPDPANPGGPGDPGDVLYSLNIGGGLIEATFTSAGTGGPGNLFPGHLYEGPITFQTAMEGLPIHPNNLMNDGRSLSNDRQVRRLIPDFTATLLADIYGYTVALPSTINTFYANLNVNTNDLVVRGDTGDVDDSITINESGSNLRVLVNGTSERIPASEIDFVTIFGQEGNDEINIDQTPEGLPVSANGGLDDDVITIANSSDNLTLIDGDITANGGPGVDVLDIRDSSRNTAQTYQITSSSVTPNGLDFAVSYVNFDTVVVQGTQGASLFNIEGVAFQTAMSVFGNDGDDTFNIGGNSLFASLNGFLLGAELNTNGGIGNDVVRFDDGANVVSSTYTLSHVSLQRSGLSSPLSYANMESVSLETGSGNDVIDVIRTAVATTVDGNGGSDTVMVGNGDIDSNITADLMLMGGIVSGASDHVVLEDELDTNNDDYFLNGNTFQKFNFVGSLTYDDSFELLTLQANAFNNSIFVNSVNPNRQLVVNGLGGNDDIHVGDGDIDTNIRGDVVTHGGPGVNQLFLHDSQDQAGSDTYTITGTTFDKTNYVGTLSFSSFDEITLFANDFANTVDIQSTSPGTEWIIFGNDGADQFNVNAPPASDITVHGGDPAAAPGDLLRVTGTPVSTGEYHPSPVTPGNGTVTVDGHDIAFTGLEPVIANLFQSFRIVLPNSNDDLVIEDLVDKHVIRGTSGGVAFEELQFSNIDRFTVDMATNDALLFSSDRLRLQGGNMSLAGTSLLVVEAGVGANSLLVRSGITNLNTSVGGNLGRNLDVRVSGSLTELNFLETQQLKSLSITSGLVSLEPNGAQTVLVVEELAISGGAAPTGTIDLNDNGVIIDYADVSPSPYPQVRDQIRHARNQNAPALWTGTGIKSSLAASNSTSYAVGFAEADAIFAGNPVNFLGHMLALGNQAVLIRATRNGDANLDGVTDGSDFGIWNSHKFSPGDWAQGDFNYDGVVDGSDFGIWNANKFTSLDLGPEFAREPNGAVKNPKTLIDMQEIPEARPVPPRQTGPIWQFASRLTTTVRMWTELHSSVEVNKHSSGLHNDML
jgi:uncharacterized Zn-binding protein involved in type VI secretion